MNGGLLPERQTCIGSGPSGPLLLRLGLSGNAEAAAWRQRCRQLLTSFAAEYPGQPTVRLFSAPGRTEICGNHTDHQNGRVLCAAVNRDILAAAAPNGLNMIRLRSAGFAEVSCIDLGSLDARPVEAGTSAALIRGIAAAFCQRGLPLAGIDIFTDSNVPRGSGLSSSAAFEVLVATILEAHSAPDSLTPLERARIGQWAENTYFGKPSGLMDQCASAAGGLLTIDFAEPDQPVLEPLALDLDDAGYDLVIVHTGGSHADLVSEYAAIPAEMRAVAACFGQSELRAVSEQAFKDAWPTVRRLAGDRALLRAAHFFAENHRVAALRDLFLCVPERMGQPDMAAFLHLIDASGISSWTLLQNLYATSCPSDQPLCVGLTLAARLLAGDGACRVHGGGFGGTFQAFVPHARTQIFCREMDALFGAGSAEQLRIRSAGAIELDLADCGSGEGDDDGPLEKAQP